MINLFSSKCETPLYCRYDGLIRSQPAYVEIDVENSTIDAEYNSEIGNAVPGKVWHGICRRYGVSPYLSREQVDELIAEIVPFAAKMVADAEIVWNGNDFVCKLGAKAEEAEIAISERCAATKDEVYEVYVASDWLACDGSYEQALLDLLKEHDWDVESCIKTATTESAKNGIRLVETHILARDLELACAGNDNK